MLKNKILISACLTGTKCRYNGKDAFNKEIIEIIKNNEVIILCPELLSGQPIPRPACNINCGDGFDVISGNATVIGIDGIYYTESYLAGAKKALDIALENNVKVAYLKSKSPTCGCGKIFDETGQNLKIGNGILTALLIQNGIKVISMD